MVLVTFKVLFPFLSMFQLAELRQECEARGLDTKGNKGELIARLQAYLEEHGEQNTLQIVTYFRPGNSWIMLRVFIFFILTENVFNL